MMDLDGDPTLPTDYSPSLIPSCLLINLGANAFQADLLGWYWLLLHRGEEHQVRCEEVDASQVRPHSQPVRTLHRAKTQEMR